MGKWLRLFAIVLLCSVLSGSVAARQLTGKEIVQKADNIIRGEKSNFTAANMTIVTAKWKRTLGLKVWMKGLRKTFIRITSPAKERGVGTLKINYELWNYLPKVERTIKIPPSMMMQPWMGSDFTNDDIARESSIVNDYNHRLIGIVKIGNISVYKVRSKAKKNAPVVWDKVFYYARKKDFIPVRQEYYNERGKKIKVLTLSHIKFMGGRNIPTKWVMRTVTKKGAYTVLEIKESKFNINISDAVFTHRNLKKVR